MADCPLSISGPSAVHSVNPPEITTSLGKLLILPADRPALLGGPSTVHLRETPRNTTPLDKLYPNLRTVRCDGTAKLKLQIKPNDGYLNTLGALA